MKLTYGQAAALVLGLVVAGCTSRAPTPSSSAAFASATSAVLAPVTNSPPSPAGATPTFSPGPTLAVPGVTLPPPVESLLSAPRDCPSSMPPDDMTLKNFGGGFGDGVVVRGRAPVWTLGLPSDGVLHLPPVDGNGAPFPNAKIMWIVGPNEPQPVTVWGRERSNGGPLWFQIYPSNGAPGLPSSYTTRLVLDPVTPNRGYAANSGGSWSIWGIGVGALAAGCYQMTVSSSEDAWTIQLAIGT